MRVVVKLGGSLVKLAALATELSAYPEPVAVVHGGGKQIDLWLERLGFTTRFEQGLRVSPPEQIEVIEMVLTTLGKGVAQTLSEAGRPAVGISGRDALLLPAQAVSAKLGRVGKIQTVNRAFLEVLLEAGLTPVVSPIGFDSQGALNLNADTVAGEIAGSLGAGVIFLTDVPGVLADPTDPTSRYSELDQGQVAELMEQGTISGGMIPKVQAAQRAVASGAAWAAIGQGLPGNLGAIQEGRAGTRFI